MMYICKRSLQLLSREGREEPGRRGTGEGSRAGGQASAGGQENGSLGEGDYEQGCISEQIASSAFSATIKQESSKKSCPHGGPLKAGPTSPGPLFTNTLSCVKNGEQHYYTGSIVLE